LLGLLIPSKSAAISTIICVVLVCILICVVFLIFN
jgi:preprotein translocase subunit SecE